MNLLFRIVSVTAWLIMLHGDWSIAPRVLSFIGHLSSLHFGLGFIRKHPSFVFRDRVISVCGQDLSTQIHLRERKVWYCCIMWYSFTEPCIQRSEKKWFVTTWKLKLQDLKGKAARFYSWGSIIIPWNFKSGLEQELPTVSVDSVSPQSGKRHISPLRMVGILFQRQCGIPTFKSFAI